MKVAIPLAVALLALATGAGAALGQPTPTADRWVLVVPVERKSVGTYPTKEACLQKLGGVQGKSPMDARCVSERELEYGLHHRVGSLHSEFR
jgi:hypothetical protein